MDERNVQLARENYNNYVHLHALICGTFACRLEEQKQQVDTTKKPRPRNNRRDLWDLGKCVTKENNYLQSLQRFVFFRFLLPFYVPSNLLWQTRSLDNDQRYRLRSISSCHHHHQWTNMEQVPLLLLRTCVWNGTRKDAPQRLNFRNG